MNRENKEAPMTFKDQNGVIWEHDPIEHKWVKATNKEQAHGNAGE